MIPVRKLTVFCLEPTSTNSLILNLIHTNHIVPFEAFPIHSYSFSDYAKELSIFEVTSEITESDHKAWIQSEQSPARIPPIPLPINIEINPRRKSSMSVLSGRNSSGESQYLEVTINKEDEYIFIFSKMQGIDPLTRLVLYLAYILESKFASKQENLMSVLFKHFVDKDYQAIIDIKSQSSGQHEFIEPIYKFIDYSLKNFEKNVTKFLLPLLGVLEDLRPEIKTLYTESKHFSALINRIAQDHSYGSIYFEVSANARHTKQGFAVLFIIDSVSEQSNYILLKHFLKFKNENFVVLLDLIAKLMKSRKLFIVDSEKVDQLTKRLIEIDDPKACDKKSKEEIFLNLLLLSQSIGVLVNKFNNSPFEISKKERLKTLIHEYLELRPWTYNGVLVFMKEYNSSNIFSIEEKAILKDEVKIINRGPLFKPESITNSDLTKIKEIFDQQDVHLFISLSKEILVEQCMKNTKLFIGKLLRIVELKQEKILECIKDHCSNMLKQKNDSNIISALKDQLASLKDQKGLEIAYFNEAFNYLSSSKEGAKKLLHVIEYINHFDDNIHKKKLIEFFLYKYLMPEFESTVQNNKKNYDSVYELMIQQISHMGIQELFVCACQEYNKCLQPIIDIPANFLGSVKLFFMHSVLENYAYLKKDAGYPDYVEKVGKFCENVKIIYEKINQGAVSVAFASTFLREGITYTNAIKNLVELFEFTGNITKKSLAANPEDAINNLKRRYMDFDHKQKAFIHFINKSYFLSAEDMRKIKKAKDEYFFVLAEQKDLCDLEKACPELLSQVMEGVVKIFDYRQITCFETALNLTKTKGRRLSVDEEAEEKKLPEHHSFITYPNSSLSLPDNPRSSIVDDQIQTTILIEHLNNHVFVVLDLIKNEVRKLLDSGEKALMREIKKFCKLSRSIECMKRDLEELRKHGQKDFPSYGNQNWEELKVACEAYIKHKDMIKYIKATIDIKTDFLDLKNPVFYERLTKYVKEDESDMFSRETIKNFLDEYNGINQLLTDMLKEKASFFDIGLVFLKLSKYKNEILTLCDLDQEKLILARARVVNYDNPKVCFEDIKFLQEFNELLKVIKTMTDSKDIMLKFKAFFMARMPLFNVVIGKWKEIKDEVLNPYTQPGTADLNSVKGIMEKCDIRFEKNIQEDKIWHVTCFGFSKESNEPLHEAQLYELIDKAFLYVQIYDNAQITKEIQMKVELFHKFIDFAKKVCAILNVLNDINDLYYPKIELLYRGECSNDNFGFLEGMEKLVKNIKESWEQNLCILYQKFPVMTHFTPIQILDLIEYFFGEGTKAGEEAVEKLKMAEHKVKALLEFAELPNSLIKQASHYEEEKNVIPKPAKDSETKEKKTIEETIKQMHKLGEIFEKEAAKSSSNPDMAVQQGEITIWDLLVCKPTMTIPQIDNKNLEQIKKENLMGAIFFKFKNKVPPYNRLLFCHKKMKYVDLLCFLLRIITHPKNDYALIYPEKLSYDTHKQFIIKIMEEENLTKLKQSNLGIITANKRAAICQYAILSLDAKENIPRKISKSECEKAIITFVGEERYKNNIIYESAFAGSGKTTLIEENAKSSKLYWITLSGDVTIESIIKDLTFAINNIVKTRFPSLIAFKVYQIMDPNLLNSVFLQLLLYGSLFYQSELISLPPGTMLNFELEKTAMIPFNCRKFFHWSRMGNDWLCNINLNKSEILLASSYLMMHRRAILNHPAILFTDIMNPPPITDLKELKKAYVEYFMQEAEYIPNSKKTLIQLNTFCTFLSYMIKKLRNINIKRESLNASPKQLIFILLLNTAQNLSDLNIISNLRIQDNMEKNPNSTPDLPDQPKQLSTYQQATFQSCNIDLAFFHNNRFCYVYKDINKVSPAAIELAKHSNYKRLLDQKYNSHESYKRYLCELFSAFPGNDYYVLTMDNFFMILFIFIRSLCKVPTILVGATGCGKTSTIKFMCQGLKLGILRELAIHAGLSKDNICNFVSEVENEAKKNPDLKYWIFFDEFNTNENLGCMTEMMCDRVLNGKKLSKNILFFAACNPYKLISNQPRSWDESVGLAPEQYSKVKKLAKKKLLYHVFPLPDTIREYSCYFGIINPESEELYIKQILSQCTDFADDEDKKNEEYNREKIIKLIIGSHKFFQEHYYSNLVSLRDIIRFKKLYQFFRQDSNPKLPVLKAVQLSLLFCYYYRISDLTARKNYLTTICKIINPSRNKSEILALLESQMDYYLKDISLEKFEGVVMCNSLREIIFVMIICILNYIPLLVVGKPGCSKSLAISIIARNFLGRDSKTEGLRARPEFTFFVLQGSTSVTSEGIEAIFERAIGAAHRYTGSAPGMIPVVLIEEIGVCDLSPHNPLKVLHKYLDLQRDKELKNMNDRVSFIGLSNWKLEPAKNNRTLYLARLPPDKEELEKIAVEICKLYGIKNPYIFVKMVFFADAYYEYLTQFDQQRGFVIDPDTKKDQDRYGLRDFYAALHEMASKFSKDLEENSILVIMKIASYRYFNFNKVGKCCISLWDTFLKQQDNHVDSFVSLHNQINELTMVKESLSKLQRKRYVLLVGKPHVTMFLLHSVLKNETKGMRMIVRSEFESDRLNTDYKFRLLSTIIYCFSQLGNEIIMYNLGDIYLLLMDLFNANFNHECRVAVSQTRYPLFQVKDSFYAILTMTYEQYIKENPALLNRLEKRIFKLDELISDYEVSKAYEQLMAWLEAIFQPRYEEIKDPLTQKEVFYGLEKNELKMVIYCISHNSLYRNMYNQSSFQLLPTSSKNSHRMIEEDKDSKELLRACKAKLIEMATMELPLMASVSRLTEEERQEIYSLYTATHQRTLKAELEACLKPDISGNRMLFITFANLQYLISEIKLLEGIKALYISQIKDEEGLKLEIYDFFKAKEDSKKLLLVFIDGKSEYKHIDLIISIIDQYALEYDPNNKKSVCILVFSKRMQKTRFAYFTTSYTMRLYDSFEARSELFSKSKEGYDDMIIADCRKIINKDFQNILAKAYALFSRGTQRKSLQKEPNQKAPGILSNDEDISTVDLNSVILNEEKMVEKLLEPFLKHIETAFKVNKIDQEIIKILCSKKDKLLNETMEQRYSKLLNDYIVAFMKLIIDSLDTYSALNTYFIKDKNTIERQQMWIKYFERFKIDWKRSINETFGTKIIIPNLKLPFSKLVYDMIQKSHCRGNKNTLSTKDILREFAVQSEMVKSSASWKTQLFKDIIKITLRYTVGRSDKALKKHISHVILPKGDVSEINNLENGISSLIASPNLIVNFVRIIEKSEELLKSKIPTIPTESTMNAYVKEFCNDLILKLQPSKELMIIVDSYKYDYSKDLKYIMYFIMGIDLSLRREIKNFILLKFWIEFSRLMMSVYFEKGTQYILATAIKLNSIIEAEKIDGPALGIISPKFKTYILSEALTPEFKKIKPEAYYNFKCMYYEILFNGSKDYLNDIVKLFNEEPEGLPYYVKLIPEIVEKAGLKELPSSVDLKKLNEPDSFIKKLDAFIDFSSTFTQLLFFYIANKSSHQNIVKHQELSREHVIIAGSPSKVSGIDSDLFRVAKLVSLAFIRQITMRMIEKGKCYDLRNFRNYVEKGRTELAPFLKVFILKVLKSSSLNSQASHGAEFNPPERLKENLELQVNFDILNNSSSECFIDLFPNFFIEPDKKAFFCKICQICRQMKLMNIVNDEGTLNIYECALKESIKNQKLILPFLLANISELLFVFYRVNAINPCIEIYEKGLEAWKELRMFEEMIHSNYGGPGNEVTSFLNLVLSNFASLEEFFQLPKLKMLGDDGLAKLAAICTIAVVISSCHRSNAFVSLFYTNGVFNENIADILKKAYILGNNMTEGDQFKPGYINFCRRKSLINDIDLVSENYFTYSVFKFMLNAMFSYSYHRIDKYFKDIFEKDKDINYDLNDAMLKAYVDIVSIIREKIKISESKPVFFLFVSIIIKIQDIFCDMPGNCMNRDDVEKLFKRCCEEVTKKYLICGKEHVNELTEESKEYMAGKDYITHMDILQETKMTPSQLMPSGIPLDAFFRLYKKPTRKDFFNAFQLVKDDYPLIEILGKIKEEQFVELSLLSPLIQFVNKVHQMCDYKINRVYANSTKLPLNTEELDFVHSFMGPGDSPSQTRGFKRALIDSSLNANNEETKIDTSRAITNEPPPSDNTLKKQYEEISQMLSQLKKFYEIQKCSLPRQIDDLQSLFILDKPKEISNYVIDKQSSKSIVAAALEYLADTQNNIKEKLFKLLHNSRAGFSIYSEYLYKYPIQSLSEEDIILFSESNYDDMANYYSLLFKLVSSNCGALIANPGASELISPYTFNFDKIEGDLILSTNNKKCIDTSSYEYIKYVDDFSAFLNLIKAIDQKIPQTQTKTIDEIKYLKELNLQIEMLITSVVTICELYDSVQYLLQWVAKSRGARLSPKTTILELTHKIAKCDIFDKITVFSNIYLSSLIDAVAVIEDASYTGLEASIKPLLDEGKSEVKLTSKPSSTQIKLLNKDELKKEFEMISKKFTEIQWGDGMMFLLKAIRRYLVRWFFLPTQNMNEEIKKEAKSLIFSEELWPIEKKAQIKIISELFPESILVCNLVDFLQFGQNNIFPNLRLLSNSSSAKQSSPIDINPNPNENDDSEDDNSQDILRAARRKLD